MWVTGNMASNMSLEEKETEREEEEGKREGEHSYYLHTCHYGALLNSSSKLFTHSHTQTCRTHTGVCSMEERHNGKYTVSSLLTGTIAKGDRPENSG